MFEEPGAAGGTCPDLLEARAGIRVERSRNRFLIKSIPQRRSTGDRKGAGFQISGRADATIYRSASLRRVSAEGSCNAREAQKKQGLPGAVATPVRV